MAEHEQEHHPRAKMSDLKRIIRRKKGKHEHEEEMGLNIYPMMDMMTILLVFLIMQFATTQANVVESAELHFPVSTATQDAVASVAITVSANSVVVENNDGAVLPLRNGIVDPSLKQGGGNGFLITPLLTVMQRNRDRLKLIARMNPARPFLGQVQLIADVNTPYSTITAILYTCGQAEFSKVHFLVKRQAQAADGAMGTQQP